MRMNDVKKKKNTKFLLIVKLNDIEDNLNYSKWYLKICQILTQSKIQRWKNANVYKLIAISTIVWKGKKLKE